MPYFVENHKMILDASKVEGISAYRRLKHERLNASGMLHGPNSFTMKKNVKDHSKHR
jgi:hypothetical protein